MWDFIAWFFVSDEKLPEVDKRLRDEAERAAIHNGFGDPNCTCKFCKN